MGLLIECPECRKLNNSKAKICTGKLVECPQCKKRHSPKTKICLECKRKNPKPQKEERVPCGFNRAKFSGRAYWIECYQDGQRHRKRTGFNKTTAERVAGNHCNYATGDHLNGITLGAKTLRHRPAQTHNPT